MDVYPAACLQKTTDIVLICVAFSIRSARYSLVLAFRFSRVVVRLEPQEKNQGDEVSEARRLFGSNDTLRMNLLIPLPIVLRCFAFLRSSTCSGFRVE